MAPNEERLDEERDSVAPQPELHDPADAGGDSPGPEIGAPDEPAASDRHGTTVEEQREPSLERRLGQERPDEDLDVEEPRFDAQEADLDRTRQEAAEESPELEDEGPEGAAMHVEPD
jgi:hypothetical protein